MVHKTKDYDKFGFNYLNREVDAIHVRRLIKDMKGAGLRVPIIVDENMEVIDGQHRLTACRELGIEVEYIVRDRTPIEDIVRMNNLSKNWTVKDKCVSYAKAGNSDYQRLLEFYNICQGASPKYSMVTASRLVQGSAASYTAKDGGKMNLGAGTWEFKGTLEQAIARLHAIEHFRDYAWYTNGNFITAFLRCLREVEKFDPKRLLKQAKKYPGQFVCAGSTDEFLRVFENTYNHNKVGRNRVRLF